MIISVASLKGGTGKTTITTNLAYAFANLKKKVLVFDSDFGANNIDLYFNIDIAYDVKHYLNGSKTFKEIICKKNDFIDIISGNSGTVDTANLSDEKIDKIVGELLNLKNKYDIILIDSAPTFHYSTFIFSLKSDAVVMTPVPEYPAMMDVYQWIKNLLIKKFDSNNIFVVVNRTQSAKDGMVTFESLRSAVLKFFGKEIKYLGSVENSKAFEKAMIRKKPIYEDNYYFRKLFDKFVAQILKEVKSS